MVSRYLFGLIFSNYFEIRCTGRYSEGDITDAAQTPMAVRYYLGKIFERMNGDRLQINDV